MKDMDLNSLKRHEKLAEGYIYIYTHKTGVCLSAFRLKYFLNMNLYMLAHAEYKYSIKTHMINFFFF